MSKLFIERLMNIQVLIVQGFYHQKKQPGFDDRHNTNNQGEHKEISVIVFIEFR